MFSKRFAAFANLVIGLKAELIPRPVPSLGAKTTAPNSSYLGTSEVEKIKTKKRT